MLKSCFENFERRGIHKAYLWVLENNPTIGFYEKVGGTKLDFIKEDKIGSRKVVDWSYSWTNLKI